MHRLFYPVLNVLIVLIFVLTMRISTAQDAFSDDTMLDFYSSPNSSGSEHPWGLTLTPSTEQQSYSNNTHSTLDTLLIRPYLDFGNWEVAVVAPYQRIVDASYFNRYGPAGPRALCTRINQLTATQFNSYVTKGVIGTQTLHYCRSHHLLKSAYHAKAARSPMSTWCQQLDQMPLNQINQMMKQGKINSALVHFCKIPYVASSGSSTQAVNGWNDLGMELIHHFGSTNPVWSGYLGVLAKDDNGNTDAGLGTGTRTLSLEYSLSAHHYFVQTTLSGGYTFVEPNPYSYTSFPYASLDTLIFPNTSIHPGLSYNYQPASLSTLTDTQYFSLYLEWQPASRMQLHLYSNRYLHPNAYYPLHDYGAYLNLSF